MLNQLLESSALSRRAFALLAAAGLWSACKKEESAEQEATSVESQPLPVAVPTADVHTHLFNANFLPLDGIFAKWVPHIIASAVASILLSHVDECKTFDAGLAAAGAPDPLSTIENQSETDLLDNLYAATPETAFDSREVIGGLSSVAPPGKLASAETGEQRKKISRPEFDKMFADTAEGAKEVFPAKGGFLQWVTLMTWCERKIWSAVTHAYPDVQLFVAHMMDMENYYTPTEPPKYDWPTEQLRRMAS
ncbi:MAG TPA: hypothetical protein VN181_14820 [Thermoanaerobaculia bacterium]|nr:hypothetical protein [Thermoanaerobaculia bacterium]